MNTSKNKYRNAVIILLCLILVAGGYCMWRYYHPKNMVLKPALTSIPCSVLFGVDPGTGCMGRGVCSAADIGGNMINTTMNFDGTTFSIQFSDADLKRIQPNHANDFDGPFYQFDVQWNIPSFIIKRLILPVPAISPGIDYPIDNSIPGTHILNIPLN